MKVIEVERGEKSRVREFLQLPFAIYRDIPQWVPPLMGGERARFKADFALFEHSEGAFYLVEDDSGRITGRCAVFIHRPYNNYHQTNDAFIYLYEAEADDQTAAALFAACENWAMRRGADELVGPKGFMTGDASGLLIEGFEHRPAIGVNYNPPYYVDQWERIGGMVKRIDFISAYAEAKGFVYPDRVQRIAEKVKDRKGFHVPKFKTKRELAAMAPAIQEAYNAAFVDLWSYTPISDGELKAIVDRLILIADPALIKLIFKEEKIAGFTFTYPDISAAIQRTKGEIFPFGWVELLREKKRTLWANVNGNAILPEYQGAGANAVLYHELITSLLESRYQYVDIVQIQETNYPMLADLAAIMPINPYKRHRVYAKKLRNPNP